MLQTSNNPDRLQLMCNISVSSSGAWQTQADELGINASCRLTTGSCKYVYSSALCGVAGWFGQQDLQVLRQCMIGGISYTECDQKVRSCTCEGAANRLHYSSTWGELGPLPAEGCPNKPPYMATSISCIK